MDKDRLASNWKDFEGKKKYQRENPIGDPPEEIDGRREPYFGNTQEQSGDDGAEGESVGREF